MSDLPPPPTVPPVRPPAPLPPPVWTPHPDDPAVPFATRHPRPPRVGELTPTWRIALILTWIGVFLAWMAVWKASEEIGVGTWWLGPRSNPQTLLVRLVPFLVTALFGVLASYNLRRLPAIGVVGALALAAIAVPDLTRSTGLAVVEFALAAAVLLVSLAAFTGTYRSVDGADNADNADNADTIDSGGAPPGVPTGR